jgi:hypothetical protein
MTKGETMSKKNKETTPEDKISILADLWINYRTDEEFTDFVEYNDLGLPLAYAVDAGIVTITPLAQKFIDETFELLLAGLDIEDLGFDSLDVLLGTLDD